MAHPNVKLCIDILSHYKIKDVMVASTTHDGIHFLDEMGIYGNTKIVGIRNGVIGREMIFNPVEELNLPRYSPEDICEGTTKFENIMYSVNVLKGKGSNAREDVVCINAGTILYLAKKARNLKEGFLRAKDAVKTGLPYNKLVSFIEETGGCLTLPFAK